MTDDELKRSPLEAAHVKAGARLVPFAGWNMPVQYEGILAEHRAVRESCGVFDISHMGQLEVSGAGEALPWLERMLTNRVSRLAMGEGQYTFLLNERGGVIDDLIIYRMEADRYLLVVNASRTEEDVAWLRRHREDETVRIEDHSSRFGAIAVQGPDTVKVFEAMTGGARALPPRFGVSVGEDFDVCRTGYTGEDGFELLAPVETIGDWWDRAVAAGAIPCGLGARDSLRLEKCYPLNGNDLSPDRTPLEAGLGFAVDLDKDDFNGAEVLRKQKAGGLKERLVALKLTGKGPPPRPGYALYAGETRLGELSSGGLSPKLGAGIGLAYVPTGHHKVGTELEVEIRGKRFAAEVVKKPFL